MSIIYDALQKIQRDGEEETLNSGPSHHELMTHDDWIDVGIGLIIAILLAMLMISHYPRNWTFSFMKKSPVLAAVPHETIVEKPIPLVKPRPMLNVTQFKKQHILSGVFVSDKEKVAMINNHFYNLGDTVDGLKIISIEPDRIKLQNKHETIILKIVV